MGTFPLIFPVIYQFLHIKTAHRVGYRIQWYRHCRLGRRYIQQSRYNRSGMTEPTGNAAPEAKQIKGADIIRGYVKVLPEAPGVYRMLNTLGDVLYVGKAKSLKKKGQ